MKRLIIGIIVICILTGFGYLFCKKLSNPDNCGCKKEA